MQRSSVLFSANGHSECFLTILHIRKPLLLNRRTKQEQRLLADYALQVGGNDTEGG